MKERGERSCRSCQHRTCQGEESDFEVADFSPAHAFGLWLWHCDWEDLSELTDLSCLCVFCSMMEGSAGHNKDDSPIPPNATLSELIGGTPSEFSADEGGGGPGAAVAGVAASGYQTEKLPESLISSAKNAARESKAHENEGVRPVPENPPSQPATFSDAVPYITTPLDAQTAPNGTLAADPKAELAVVPEGAPIANGQAAGMQLGRPKLQRSESKMVSAVKKWQKATERVS